MVLMSASKDVHSCTIGLVFRVYFSANSAAQQPARSQCLSPVNLQSTAAKFTFPYDLKLSGTAAPGWKPGPCALDDLLPCSTRQALSPH